MLSRSGTSLALVALSSVGTMLGCTENLGKLVDLGVGTAGSPNQVPSVVSGGNGAGSNGIAAAGGLTIRTPGGVTANDGRSAGGSAASSGGGPGDNQAGGAEGDSDTSSSGTTGGSATHAGGTAAFSVGGGSMGGGDSTSKGGRSTDTGGAASGGRASGGAASGGAASGGAASGGSGAGGSAGSCPLFSFFVSSLGAMQALSKNVNGFGGDLRYPDKSVDGLTGADNICTQIAKTALPCAASKTWRAFLSTSSVDAIDRIGSGPWYDRNGLKVWDSLSEMSADRPPTSYKYRDDLPNEDGIPNHDYDLDGSTDDDDNHDVLTGSGTDGRKVADDTAETRCNDWTTTTNPSSSGLSTFNNGFFLGYGPWCGHSWPRSNSGTHWIHSLREGGCAAGVNLLEAGGASDVTVGSGGGYGGIYCFALTP